LAIASQQFSKSCKFHAVLITNGCLVSQGLTVGVKRVWRLMKAIQAQSIMQRRFRKPVTQVLYAQRPN